MRKERKSERLRMRRERTGNECSSGRLASCLLWPGPGRQVGSNHAEIAYERGGEIYATCVHTHERNYPTGRQTDGATHSNTSIR